MFKRLISNIGVAVTALVFVTGNSYAASPQRHSFDPQMSCGQIFRAHVEQGMFWAFGYQAAMRAATTEAAAGQVHMPEITPETYSQALGEIRRLCLSAPETGFATLISQLYGVPSVPVPGMPASGGDQVQATALSIEQIQQALNNVFARENVDIVATLRSMRPAYEDISAVFPEEMAKNLMEKYVQVFGSDLDDVGLPSSAPTFSAEFATTLGLKDSALYENLDGSYAGILDLFLSDVPFAQVQMTFPEDEEPIDIDGFYYVNNHWVVMPRPWRGLNQ